MCFSNCVWQYKKSGAQEKKTGETNELKINFSQTDGVCNGWYSRAYRNSLPFRQNGIFPFRTAASAASQQHIHCERGGATVPANTYSIGTLTTTETYKGASYSFQLTINGTKATTAKVRFALETDLRTNYTDASETVTITGTESSQTVTVTIPDLISGLTYYIRILDEDNATAISSNKVTIVGIPAATSSLTATPGNAEVSLSWTGVPHADSYTVYYSTANDVTTSSTKVTANTNSANITGLANGETYFFKVSATNIAGEGSLSEVASAGPDNWTLAEELNFDLYSLKFFNNKFWAVGNEQNNFSIVKSSSDGDTWSDETPGCVTSSFELMDIASDGTNIVAVGKGKAAYYNGSTWSCFNLGLDNTYHWRRVEYIGGLWIAYGSRYTSGYYRMAIAVSSDGAIWNYGDDLTWTRWISYPTTYLRDAIYNPDDTSYHLIGDKGWNTACTGTAAYCSSITNWGLGQTDTKISYTGIYQNPNNDRFYLLSSTKPSAYTDDWLTLNNDTSVADYVQGFFDGGLGTGDFGVYALGYQFIKSTKNGTDWVERNTPGENYNYFMECNSDRSTCILGTSHFSVYKIFYQNY